MPRYAERTTVAKDQSLAEIERTLTRYGATGFMYGWSGDQVMIGFVIRNRQMKLSIPLPARNSREFTHHSRGMRTQNAAQEVYDQAVRQRWRALALYVKATLEAVEAGIISMEDAFLAYTALPGGGTVGQWLQPQMQEVLTTGGLPPLLPMLED